MAKAYYALFDVDETLISMKSMFDFLYYVYQQRYPSKPLYAKYRYQLRYHYLRLLSQLGYSREHINRQYYRSYAGMCEKQIETWGQRWFTQHLSSNSGLFHHAIVAELRHHQHNGAGIILVSGSFDACLQPIAKYFEVDACLCTQLEVIDGFYTGKLSGTPVIGKGKAWIVQRYLKHAGFDRLQDCHCYGDHISDLAMLELVGYPHVFANNPKLISYAKQHDWNIIAN